MGFCEPRTVRFSLVKLHQSHEFRTPKTSLKWPFGFAPPSCKPRTFPTAPISRFKINEKKMTPESRKKSNRKPKTFPNCPNLAIQNQREDGIREQKKEEKSNPNPKTPDPKPPATDFCHPALLKSRVPRERVKMKSESNGLPKPHPKTPDPRPPATATHFGHPALLKSRVPRERAKKNGRE